MSRYRVFQLLLKEDGRFVNETQQYAESYLMLLLTISFPQLLRSGLPAFRIGRRLITEMVHALWALIVGAHSTGRFHHGPQRLRIFQHIFIERLIVRYAMKIGLLRASSRLVSWMLRLE